MDIEPGIYRPEFPMDTNFTQVPNALIRDEDVGATAKLLLIYLLSHKIGYQIRDDQMMRETGIGRHALRTARKELQELGFIELNRVRQDDNSWGGYRYELSDPRGYFSTVGYSTVEHSTVENRPDNRKPISNKTKTKKTITKKDQPKTADDYEPSSDRVEKWEEEFPGVRIDIELKKFKDYYMAAGRTWKDYNRAFANWLRRASEYSPEARAARVQAEEEAKWKKLMEQRGME